MKSIKRRLIVQKAFEEYWEKGGFPEIAGLDRQLRIKTHQEYFNAMLFRDLVERHDISHPKAVVDLAHRLMDITASQYSLNSLTGYLKSLGHKAPKAAVSDYLAWFEDAYVLFTVRIFDTSLARANVNPKKIYGSTRIYDYPKNPAMYRTDTNRTQAHSMPLIILAGKYF